jgi:hypothetical protein
LAGGFDPSGLEVATEFVGVGREPAVEVGAAGEVAVVVVGLRNSLASGCGEFAIPRSPGHPSGRQSPGLLKTKKQRKN